MNVDVRVAETGISSTTVEEKELIADLSRACMQPSSQKVINKC